MLVRPQFFVDRFSLWEQLSQAQSFMAYKLNVEHVAQLYPELTSLEWDILALMRWRYLRYFGAA